MTPPTETTAGPQRKHPRPDAEPLDDGPPRRGDQIEASPEAAAAIAASETDQLSPKQVQSATDWFLSDEQEAPSILYFDLDVAGAGQKPRWIRYAVRTLGRAEIRRIRNDATDETTGLQDDMEVNLRVLIAGSHDPNFSDPAVLKGNADPAQVVLRRFGHKPGLIEAVAGKVNQVSGYGGAALIREVDAAGN